MWRGDAPCLSACAGKPRGSRARGVDARSKAQGDCTLCVQVCPAGIDIRNGLQAACISCGLCIDACDQVMGKLGSPRGLVRFGAMQLDTTMRADLQHALMRPRVLVYGSALLALATAMVWGWLERPVLRLNAMRDRSVLVRQLDFGAVENVYRLQVMNASLRPRTLRLTAFTGEGPAATPVQVQHAEPFTVDAAGASTLVTTVRMSAEEAGRHPGGRPIPLHFVVDSMETTGPVQARTASTFLPG
ncbi:4Fe-4S dicluster domain-containing protein [Roseateles saccharophilus]|uniref:4Fe-4S dicluster domain-containing protein n=1 Tax=Roseateles saccharophilus TaxID=304 RepID=UPI00104D01CF|nr:4Fe-4S dicluster domain-containing protein [Roseateles saccharophilus]MDG0833029.1 hypothetical protein [Roseateles saccharophilus]